MLEAVALDHVVLRVRDMEAALGFYRDLLGMPEEGRERFERGAVGFISVRAGVALIDLLHDPGYAGQRDGESLVHLCLRVRAGDMAAVAAALAERGVALEDGEPQSRIGATGAGESFYARDPDGHIVEIKRD